LPERWVVLAGDDIFLQGFVLKGFGLRRFGIVQKSQARELQFAAGVSSGLDLFRTGYDPYKTGEKTCRRKVT
jgi:hypothetical protein